MKNPSYPSYFKYPSCLILHIYHSYMRTVRTILPDKNALLFYKKMLLLGKNVLLFLIKKIDTFRQRSVTLKNTLKKTHKIVLLFT